MAGSSNDEKKLEVETDNGWKGSANGFSNSCESVDESWLGGEPTLLPKEEEMAGVARILSALTLSEREQLEAFDQTMPIRHFRAAKVRTTTVFRGGLTACVLFRIYRVIPRKRSNKSRKHCNGAKILAWTLSFPVLRSNTRTRTATNIWNCGK